VEVPAGARCARHLVTLPQPAGHAGASQLRPVLVPAQEERWFYRDPVGVRTALVGNAIRHSLFPAPFHYFQMFLRADVF